MNDSVIYLDIEQALELHSWLLEKTKSSNRLKNSEYSNRKNLSNILKQIKNNEVYPEFKHKLTQLVFTINDSSKTIKDSKRLSIILGCYFLELNGYDYVVPYFVEEMENIVVWLEQGRINRDLLSEIIESLIYEDYLSEEIKLKLAIAIS